MKKHLVTLTVLFCALLLLVDVECKRKKKPKKPKKSDLLGTLNNVVPEKYKDTVKNSLGHLNNLLGPNNHEFPGASHDLSGSMEERSSAWNGNMEFPGKPDFPHIDTSVLGNSNHIYPMPHPFPLDYMKDCRAVITGVKAALPQTGTCAASQNTVCTGSLRLCANIVEPASDGTCITFMSEESLTFGSALSFKYANAHLPALRVDVPGKYYISVRQDVMHDGLVTKGIEAVRMVSLLDMDGVVITNIEAENQADTHFRVDVKSQMTPCTFGGKTEECFVKRPCVAL